MSDTAHSIAGTPRAEPTARAASETPPLAATGHVEIHHGDNLAVAATLESGSFTLIYLDPPFNTGRTQSRSVERAVAERTAARDTPAATPAAGPARSGVPTPSISHVEASIRPESADLAPDRRSYVAASPEGPVKRGFRGTSYARLRGDLRVYDDRFDDYWDFLEPRLAEAWRLLAPDGTLYLHLDYREAHYAKVLLDALFGRDCFLNELIWAYDYGAKSRSRWPTKHDTILVYVKDPKGYWFDSEAVDREPYMAPGLVTPEKAARGKLPTDVWWHTIVPTGGREKTGYPTQKPEGILRRIVQASTRPGDRVLDLFAGSGTTGAVASALGRDAVLVDDNPEAIAVMRRRIPHANVAD
ncbi:hypothetical protein GCM10022382_13550 [Microbacterium invictum]